MYKVWSDPLKNRLYVVLGGVINSHEAQAVKALVVTEVEKLKPNFDIINDISQFQMGPPKALNEIKRVMQYIEHKNVGIVYRISGNLTSGAVQFNRAALSAVKYKAKSAYSIEDADRMLDSMQNHSQIKNEI